MKIYDFIGVGFGPSNVSVAIAAEKLEINNCLFIEKKSEFAWYPGMLLDTSQLQVVFLKDLITLTDPKSKYTFLNYLFNQNRLNEFINLRKFFPDRIEFADYYKWVAEQFSNVIYSSEVKEVRCKNNILEIVTEATENTSYYTKNLIVADGLVPSIPKEVKLSDKIFHSNDCLHRLEKSFGDYRTESMFIVVGSGQTAIDILTYLRTRYPNATVIACVRGYAYKPQDDSHFVNELFFPKAVDMWYSMPKELKSKMLSYHSDVTHSAADIDMLPPLYNSYYMDKATKKNKFHIKRFHELMHATEKNGKVKAIFLDRYKEKGTVSIEGDALILATGYKRPMPINCLSGLNDCLELNEYGYLFNRDYSVKKTKNILPNIYIQGYAEQSHGFSEILVSLMPIRAKEIMHSIQENLKREKK